MQPPRTTRTLVTGGVRSGKSRYAEALLTGAGTVTYLTPGYPADPQADAEWAARVARHQQGRPGSWVTVETIDLAGALRRADTPVLIDCLGTWLTRTIDAWNTWDAPLSTWQHRFDEALDDLCEAWSGVRHDCVAVTNEVGWGLVSEYPSGRVFADLLGRVNQRMADVSTHVVLMVAGRALAL